MRSPRVSSFWRYIGLFAMIVYFISFGSFMSRMMSLDLSSDRYTVSVDLTADTHRSTRQFAQTALTTNRNLRADFPKSTLSPVPHAASDLPKIPVPSPLEKSSFRQSGDTIPGKSDETHKPEASRRKTNASESEVDDQPEVKLLRMFELQRNASGVAKPNRVDEALRHLGSANLTGSESGTGTGSGGRVVNPHPFRYLLNCETLCRKTPDLFLLVYVHTAPDHYKRRMVIRQTWGDTGQYAVAIRVVFFTGSPDSVGVQRALQFEAEQYGDVVQEDFLDTYRNLTYKGIAALKWISEYCPAARFVLKTDDDIFVNMFTLIRHLERIERRPAVQAAAPAGQAAAPTDQAAAPTDQAAPAVDRVRGLLMCLVWRGMPVMRSGKWMVSKEEWQEDTYPTYCSGSAFVLSTDVAVALHSVSYHVPFFWVDDFYITGLLPLKLGTVNHTQFMSTYLLNGNALEEKFTGPQWYKYIFSHVHNLDAIQAVWRKVVALFKGELVPTIQYLVPKNATPAAPLSH